MSYKPGTSLKTDTATEISIVRAQESEVGEVKYTSSITRTFNFLSEQVTTIARDVTAQAGGYKSGGSSAVTQSMTIENFSDFDSTREIEAMHKALVNSGGTPPPLDELAFMQHPKRKTQLAKPRARTAETP